MVSLKRIARNGLWALTAPFLLGLFISCYSSDQSAAAPPASGVVTSAGGTVTSADPALAGASVVVPPGAVASGQTVTITMNSTDTLPGTAPAGTTQAGKVILLTKDSVDNFSLPVTITVPYDKTKGDLPLVMYWDEVNLAYTAAAVIGIDASAGMVTFQTSHFSQYCLFVTAISGSSTALPSLDTHFSAGVDGFFHPNFGSFTSPGGCSLGMADFSIWYFDFMKATDTKDLLGGTPGLFNKFREGNPSLYQDDVTAHTLIAKAQNAASQIWNRQWHMGSATLDAKTTGLLFYASMLATGQPQTMILKSFDEANVERSQAETVVVYRFEQDGTTPTAGKFYLYDPNFPGEEVTLDWAMATGFANYSKAGVYTYPFNAFYYDAPSTVAESRDFKSLFNAANAAFTGTGYATFTLTAPVLVNGTATVAVADLSQVSVPVTGTVTNTTAATLNCYVNGVLAGVEPLGSGGAFSFTLTASTLTQSTNTVALVTNESAASPWSSAGFLSFNIRLTGTSVNLLVNPGFETGDTSGWFVETHTWADATRDANGFYNGATAYDTYQPGKSALVSAADGLDWIAALAGLNLPMVNVGNYALRVNSSDYDYHISSASQSGTVPVGVLNPEFKFAWAAVLEDPNHEPTGQAFVRVDITDDTTSEVVYSKFYYSYDPAFTGWLTVPDTVSPTGTPWRVINWQQTSVPLAGRNGHTITVRVTGGDCAHGGHGGYVYLDESQ